MKQLLRLSLLSAITLLIMPGIVMAAVTNVALYHLGENDSGASSGSVGSDTTVDAMGAYNLSKTASSSSLPAYSNDTIAGGSTLSMKFDGTDASPQRYGYASNISSLTDNFGIEVLVRADTTDFATGSSLLAYNGDTGGNGGWGLYRAGNTYSGLYGGVTFVSGIAAVPGMWTHLALVRASGTTTLYADGIAIGTSTAAPKTPYSNGFFVGGNADESGTGKESFRGSVDNVRVFSFNEGQFNASADLNVGFKDLAIYRFGELDSGATAGNAGNSATADMLGVHHLTTSGTGQTYSATTAGGGTTLSMDLSGSGCYSTGVFSTITDNFRLEAWASADNTTDTSVIAYNGDTGTNGGSGYGIFQHGGHWMVLFGGAFMQDFGDITTGTLTHLALERENGISRFFVDGVQVGGDFYNTPFALSTAVGAFMVGGNAVSNGEYFNGVIDEVRLVQIIPEPSTLALLTAGLLGLLAYAWRKRKS